MKQEEARRRRAEQKRALDEELNKLNWLNILTDVTAELIFGNLELERRGKHFNRSVTSAIKKKK